MFEKYERTHGGGNQTPKEPSVTFRPRSAEIHFNKSAVEEMDLLEKTANLYFDNDSKKIGIEFLNKGNSERGTFTLGKRGASTGRSLSLNGFYKAFSIKVPEESKPKCVEIASLDKVRENNTEIFVFDASDVL